MENRESSQNSQSIADFDAPTNPVMEKKGGALATTDAPNDTHGAKVDETSPRPGILRRRLPIIVAGVVVGAAAIASSIYGYRWWSYSQRFQITDSAYVAADSYQVEPAVVGVVREVSVKPNQEVKPGTALVKIDPREYQARVNQAKANLEAAKQQVELGRTRLNAIANLAAQAASANTGGNNGETPTVNPLAIDISQQRDLVQKQLQAAEAAVKQKQAELKRAELTLANTNLLALSEGRVNNINVQVGQRIQPGQELMTVIKPEPWVIANFKETQFEKIQPGQPATIKINAFPSRTFSGTVEGMVSTAVSPINTTNDTGNPSGKLIPFKVKLDPDSIEGYESRITPQMSAVVTVNIKAKPAPQVEASPEVEPTPETTPTLDTEAKSDPENTTEEAKPDSESN